MNVLTRAAACAVAVLALAAGAPAQAQGRTAQACDRVCLAGVMDQYLAALVARDPGKAPLAPHAVYSENAVDLNLTEREGLWATITKVGDQSFKAIDPVSGQVAYQGVAYEHQKARTFLVRLKVWDRQIVEIEQIVTRNAPLAMLDGAANWKSDPILSRPAQGPKQDRDDMRRRSQSYYEAILLSDSSIAHFAECSRNENGQHMIRSGSCGGDFNDRRQIYNSTITPRRTDVIDEAQNVVLSFVFMNRKGELLTYTKPGTGETLPLPESATFPGTTYAGVMMKIEEDRVAKVQGIWENIPYGMVSSWDRDPARGR